LKYPTKKTRTLRWRKERAKGAGIESQQEGLPSETDRSNPSWEKLAVERQLLRRPAGKTMGTIQTGDYVFGSNGRIVDVIAVQPITKEESYSILFDEWFFHCRLRRPHLEHTDHKRALCREVSVERSTKQLFESQDKQHSIDLSPGLQMFDADLPIDPYLLGCWLGDGTRLPTVYISGNRSLTESRKNLLRRIQSFGKPVKDEE